MKVMSFLAGLVLLSTAFIDPAPHTIGAKELIYAGLFGAVIFIFSCRIALKPIKLPYSYLYLPMGFIYILLFLSLWQAIIVNNITPYLWLRGVFPFLLYIIIIPLLYEACASKTLTVLNLLIFFLLLSAIAILAQEIVVVFSLLTPAAIRMALPDQVFQPHILASLGFLAGYATETSGKKRQGAIILASIFLLAIMITASRSLILLSAATCVFALSRKTHPMNLLLRWTFICGILIILWNALSRYGSTFLGWTYRFSKDITKDPRIEEQIAVFQEFAKHPIFGNGLGYQYSYFRSAINSEWIGGYTHNFVAYILLTTGLVGFGVFLWFLIAVAMDIIVTYRKIKLNQSQEIRAFFWGWVLCLTVTLLYAQFQSVFRALAFPLVISFALVGIVALRNIDQVAENNTKHESIK